jgi:hypothetical protein
MSDHLVEPTKMVCPHCGLPADRNQNGIQGYRCGSSFCKTFNVQWARSMTCLELQNGQLRERIKRLEDDEQRLNWLLNRGLAWRDCYNDWWKEGEWLYGSKSALEIIDAAKEAKP